MVWYGITPPPPGRGSEGCGSHTPSPFYANDVAFDGLERQSLAQLRLLMDQGPEWSYFPELYKSLFIADKPD